MKLCVAYTSLRLHVLPLQYFFLTTADPRKFTPLIVVRRLPLRGSTKHSFNPCSVTATKIMVDNAGKNYFNRNVDDSRYLGCDALRTKM